MKKFFTIPSLFIILLITVSTGKAFSQDKLEITHGPYLVDPDMDAMTVVWFTSGKSYSWVEYSEYEPSGTFPTWGGYPEIAKSSKIGLIDANTNKHVIRIKNLDPGKTYKYRVNSKEILQYHPYEVIYGETVVGDFHLFTTLDPDISEFSFGVVADIHEKDQILYDLNSVKVLKDFDMMFLNGDILSWIGEEERIFGGFLDASVDLFASEKPFIYIRGNHETRGPGAREVMSYFPHHSGQNYYSMDHGGVHFIILDCGEDKPDDHPVYAGMADFDGYRSEQAEWLRKEVQTDDFRNASYRIVITHMPMSNNDSRHGSFDIYKKWGPILNQANIDLVINGHKHRYDRIDAGEEEYNFPSIVLGKEMIMDTKVSEQNLDISITDTEDKVVDAFSINKKVATKAVDWRMATSVGNIAKFNAETAGLLSLQGFTEIEIGLGRVKSEDDLRELKDNVKRVRKLTEEAGINVWSIHIPYGKDIDISLLDDEARNLAIEEVTMMIKAVKPLNPEKLVIHPSFEPIPDNERAERLKACISSLPGLVEIASKNDMNLCIEDLPRTCLGNTSQEILEILHQVEGLEVCCDVNHLLQETTEEFIRAVGPAITTLHICDYDGIDERHWLPGEGIIKWDLVIESLEKAGYDGPWMFESKGTLEEKAQVWEDLKKNH